MRVVLEKWPGNPYGPVTHKLRYCFELLIFTNPSHLSSASVHLSSNPCALNQHGTQLEIPTASPDIDSLRKWCDDPILDPRIPIRQVATRQFVRECLRLAGLQRDVVKAAKNRFGIVWPAVRDVLCWWFWLVWVVL